jgi:anti-sigma factor RsiW
MTCESCSSLIDDYVDGLLAADERRAIDAHLAGCAACRTLAADLGTIRRVAGDLERHVPPPRVWNGLAAAVEAEPRRRSWAAAVFSWRPLAAAALVVLLAGGGAWLVLRALPEPGPARTATAPADPARLQTVEAKLKTAEQQYQEAITELEQVVQAESTTLDPQVRAVLEKNLGVIDQAIGESRAALQSQPMNLLAQESLFEAFRNKVALLQDAIVLINEMRKGNPEGTARAVSGLNQ